MTDGEAVARPVSVEGETATEGHGPVARLYAELAPELRRFILGVLADPELTDDVLQATFIKAIESGHQARSETFRGWLFQVAFREALALRRRQAVRDRGHRRLADFGPTTDDAPDDGLLRNENIEAVRDALRKIPEEQRAVILARIHDDKTFAQIASEMGLPLGTVLTRMRRGLDRLRNSLRPRG
jgi:RNA polymerase sigma-70 factor (ECF subfamily)